KLVSRRSMRMQRSCSALPRNAVISCRRSVSLSGRKSIDVLPSRKRDTKEDTFTSALLVPQAAGKPLGQCEPPSDLRAKARRRATNNTAHPFLPTPPVTHGRLQPREL